MPDPNSIPFSVSSSSPTPVIAAPGPFTSLGVGQLVPYALGFIRILAIEGTASATAVVTITSAGTTFPTRTLDTIQTVAGGGVVRHPSDGAGNAGVYDCDPGSSFDIAVSSGTFSGSVRYTIIGAG